MLIYLSDIYVVAEVVKALFVNDSPKYLYI